MHAGRRKAKIFPRTEQLFWSQISVLVQLCFALEFSLFLITFWPYVVLQELCFHIHEPSPSTHFILDKNMQIIPFI